MWRRMVICRARSVFTCLTMYILSGALLCSCAPHHLELTQAETQRSTPSPSSRESSLHTSRKASLKPKNLRPLKAQSQDRDPAHIQALQLPKDELPRACLDIKVQDQGQVSATSLTPQIHTQPSPERGVFWWSLARHRYSIPRVLASPRRMRSLIALLQRHHLQRVYLFAQSMLRGRRRLVQG